MYLKKNFLKFFCQVNKIFIRTHIIFFIGYRIVNFTQGAQKIKIIDIYF